MAPHRLDPLFNPRSVAIIGASERSTWTTVMRQCLQAYGFTGPIYAVNRSGEPVFNWQTVTSCSAIGDPVDAAYICVPVDGVGQALEDIGRAGIKAAVVLSSGYSETGAEGALAQRRLADRASALGIQLLGPNCLGFANIRARTALTAIPPRGQLLPDGRVGLVCQSGATAAEIVEFAQQQGVALGFFAATGNEAQIAIADVVDYLVEDADTRVIMLFAETIRHTDRFCAAAKQALRAGKPIVVLKAGTSELSGRVAQAHTGSLVGDDRVFSAACRQLGVIRVNSLEDLVLTAGLLAQTGPLPAGGAAIVSISGGACTLIGDLAEQAGLPLPAFAPATVGKLRTALPDYANTLNPLDVTGAAVRDPTLFDRTLSILADDPGIAIRLCVLNLPHVEGTSTPTPAMLAAVGRGLRTGATPALLTVQTIKPVSDVSRRIMTEHDIPGVIGGLDHAVRAAARAIWWSHRARAHRPQSPRTHQIAGPHEQATQEVAPPVARTRLPRAPLSERAVLDYLSTFGVGVIPAILTQSPEAAARCARQFSGPVALKVVSPDLPHKTEAGGVRLGLEGEAQVAAAWTQIHSSVRAAAPSARIEGVSVAPMREAGVELFVGITRDPDWGMIIAVGLGGIWVEALRDTSIRLLPVDRAEVLQMLAELRGRRILDGWRGSPAADLNALADSIIHIGTGALALGDDLATLEVNPLMARGAQVEALDALVLWREPRDQACSAAGT